MVLLGSSEGKPGCPSTQRSRRNPNSIWNDDAHPRGGVRSPALRDLVLPGLGAGGLHLERDGGYLTTGVIDFEYPDQVPHELVVDRETMLQTTIR